jgi:TorA maturation chaperone TorD
MRTRSEDLSAGAEVALDEALARAVLYHALSASLRRLAAEERQRLFSPAGRAALTGAAALLDADRPSAEAVRPLLEEWAALSAAVREAVTETHERLFGHSRGLVCAFETEYGPEGGFEQPQTLADIAGSYRAFGLMACASQDERVDHVACECEFLEFLARKEAYTLGLGLLGDELAIVRAAERGFLREHLGRFGRAFASRLLKEDSTGFFGALGAVLFAFLTQECRRFGVTPGRPVLALRPPTLDDAPLACGSAGGCGSPSELIQVQRQRP